MVEETLQQYRCQAFSMGEVDVEGLPQGFVLLASVQSNEADLIMKHQLSMLMQKFMNKEEDSSYYFDHTRDHVYLSSIGDEMEKILEFASSTDISCMLTVLIKNDKYTHATMCATGIASNSYAHLPFVLWLSHLIAESDDNEEEDMVREIAKLWMKSQDIHELLDKYHDEIQQFMNARSQEQERKGTKDLQDILREQNPDDYVAPTDKPLEKLDQDFFDELNRFLNS